MKILLVSDSYEAYGAEKMLSWLGKILLESHNSVTFCSFYDKKRSKEIASDGLYVGLKFERSASPLKRNVRYFLCGAYRLVKLQLKYHYDYVVTFKENPMCVVLISRLFYRIKHIHSERDNPYNRDTVSSKMKMKLYRFVTKVVFQTEGARGFFGDEIKLKSVLIPNPVLVPNSHWSFSDAKKTFVCVGRLDIRYKRQDLLISAFSRIANKYPDWEVVLYGDGNDRCILEKMVKEYNVSDKVHFNGKIENVSEKIVKDGVFVLTSDSEGIPNALMEAMALAMPVITTDCEPGGARLLVSNNINGLLVKRGDIDCLKDALEYAINHHSDMIKLGIEARREMSKYAPSVIANKWISLFIE